jgi:DNA-binding NarL/FixJ family response regulator
VCGKTSLLRYWLTARVKSFFIKTMGTSSSGNEGSTGSRNWKEGLLLRRYHFPPSGERDQDLAARIEESGLGYFFPLGTPDANAAADKARQIYELIQKEGWAAANKCHCRELIVAFEWCLQPVLWTYTTIHTLVGARAVPESNPAPAEHNAQRVLVVEMDAGIRNALCWSINQQAGFCSIPCPTVDAFGQAVEQNKPHLVILNRNLAGRLGIENPGTIASLRRGLAALTYSVYADGDQMFVSTPGGAEGYLVKRVKPDRLLEPATTVSGRQEILSENLLADVKAYFKKLLHSPSSGDKSALAKLTRRECEVLALLTKGLVDKEIAQAMGISIWTVHGYIKSIFERLKVHTRTEAVVRYLEK